MTLPAPYYQDDACTIYHGDCREILPELPKVDLVLTDPPYGINADKHAFSASGSNGWKCYGDTNWDTNRPAGETLKQVIDCGAISIIWGGNYFADLLPPSMGWLIWDKGQRKFTLADCEMAWTSMWKAARIYTVPRARALRDGKRHPTQKSLELMKWCICIADKVAEIHTILDPFMGSGTTLRAAKDLGRISIGIEIEEKYCEIAANRLRQEVLSFGGK